MFFEPLQVKFLNPFSDLDVKKKDGYKTAHPSLTISL